MQSRFVQPNAIVLAKNGVQSSFSIHSRCLFVTSVQAHLTKFFGLNPLQQHVVIAHKQWKENILVNFAAIVSGCVLESGARVLSSALETFWTRKLLA